MRVSGFAILTLFATAGSALAADLPASFTKAPPYVPTEIYNWTGFYIGGHVGGGWAQSDWTFRNRSFFNFNGGAGDSIGTSPSGWLGGAHVGFNYQINHLVLGIEGTWSAADIKDTVVSPFFPTEDHETTKISSLYTVTGRIGAAWDKFLFYGKGGWAGGEVEVSAVSTAGAGGGTSWNPGKQSRSGWVAGVGLEYMLTQNFIVGVEYNHIDLGTARYSTLDSGGDTTLTSVDNTTKVDTIVGRLSYKFGGFGGPVVAKY